MTGKVWLQRAFPFVLPPVLWTTSMLVPSPHLAVHSELSQTAFQRSFRPTYWPNGLNTRRCVTEGPRPLNTRTPGRSNYLSHNWKCWKCLWHTSLPGRVTCFFQLTHIHTCGARAYLYTSLYPLPIPCWCLETFSFGYWILSKPNPNRSEERKKLTKLSCTSVKLNVNIFFSRIFLSGLQVLVQKAEAIQKHSLN